MASMGATVALTAAPVPLRVTRPWPWRVDDPETSAAPSLPRLYAPCVASLKATGRRVRGGGGGGGSGSGSGSGSGGGDRSLLELEIDTGNARVVCLRHGASHIVDRVFRFQAPVLDAVLTQFRSRQRERTSATRHSRRRRRLFQERGSSEAGHRTDDTQLFVCILSRSDCVSVHAPSGEAYDVALPFHADRIFSLAPALGGGLLIQRRPLASAPSAAATAAAFSPSHARSSLDGASPAASPVVRPRFFTLRHPLEEVKPLALSSSPPTSSSQRSVSSARQQQQLKNAAFLSDPALDLVAVFPLPGNEYGGDGDPGERHALLACYHRYEQRFVVFKMSPHVVEPNLDGAGLETRSGGDCFYPGAMSGTPRSPAASFVSPAKARQQQREVAMMEQYFKSHIVPDWSVRLVWTTPSLDGLADSAAIAKAATDSATSRYRQRAFLASQSDDDGGGDTFFGSEESTLRLYLVDERFRVLLAKPLYLSSYGDGDLIHERENDLHVIRCESALPLSLLEGSAASGTEVGVATDVLVASREGGRLFLYNSGHLVAEVALPSREVRPSYRLFAISQPLGTFAATHANANGRKEIRRFHHPLRITSPLLSPVLEVLRYVLPSKDYVKLRVATSTLASRLSPFESSWPCDVADDAHWQAFRSVLRKTIKTHAGSMEDTPMEQGARKKARATLTEDGGNEDKGSDAVALVFKSEFAQVYQHQQSAIFPAIETVPVVSMSTQVHRGAHTVTDGVDLSAEALGQVITALHLLHEELRLSASRASSAFSLARLLYELCSELELRYLSAYYSSQYSGCRDLGAAETISTTSTNLQRVHPQFDDDCAAPDVFRWLRERLQGCASEGRALGGGGSFEAVTSLVSSSSFPRLHGVNEWKQSMQSSYPLWRTEAVCRVYELLFPIDADPDDAQGTPGYDVARVTELMEFLTADKVGSRLALDDLPIGIRFVILEAIRVYRENPPHDVTERIAEFIGRRDLAGQFNSSSDGGGSATGSATSGSLVESTRLKAGAHNASADSGVGSTATREVADGLSDVVARSQRLFPSDQRLKEVARLLRSSRLLCLRLEKSADTTDQDYIAQQQARLLLLCKRSMALSVARGMVTLGTFDMTTVQNQAWQLSVPALPLAGRTPPTNATVLLDVSGYAKELTHWPQFHNGCATGLRLPGQDLSSIVTRYWIKYHRPSAAEFQRPLGARGRGNQQSTATARDIDEAHAAHAGVLLGLGLNGHLKCLSMADVYNYLSISNEFVTVAILLGMATTAARSRRKRATSSSAALQATQRRRRAKFAGTAPDLATQEEGQLPTASQAADADVDMEANVPASAAQDAQDEDASTKTPLIAGAGLELSLERSISKMLCLHIPSLLPPAFAEFSVPASTQTAALLGLGILYQGSGHRLMTELLLTEITRSPASAQFVGSQHTASNTTPSTSSSTSFEQHEGYSLAAGLALGLVLLGRGGSTAGDPGLADLGLEEKLYKYIVGGAAQPISSLGGDSSSTGSCLYRGRKWKPFGSGLNGPNSRQDGNSSNGSRNRDTGKHAGGDRGNWRGEHVNTGVTASGSALALAFMYLKSGNRSIASQLAVPDTLILLDYVRPDILLIRTLAKNLVMWDSIEASTAWVEKSEVPQQLRDAYKLLQHQSSDANEPLSSAALPEHADIRSICESYVHIVAGSCFSMGLRFAGTGNGSARDTLRSFVVYFRDMRSRSTLLGGDIVAAATNRVTIERCLSVCAQSLALVDAGTGNLETLTLLRSINLRQRVDGELTYGNHMSLSMSIGLLFLGGGRATVSRSNDAIAALVVSLYPVSAMNTADNRYHLQAFRHLYTQAVDGSRHVETVDTSSGEACSVALRVETHCDGPNGTTVRATSSFQTPCLLPEFESIDRIVVDDPTFYPVDIRLEEQDEDQDAEEVSSWGVRTLFSKRSSTTANDNRVKLLLEKSKILLEKRPLAPLASMATASALSAYPLGAESRKTSDARGQLLGLYHRYLGMSFVANSKEQKVHEDGETAWWLQRLNQKLQPLRSLPDGFMPTHLGVLYEVFAMCHPRRPFDSLVGLWNLKLIHEFHRMDPFRSLENQSRSQLTPKDAAKNDFMEWLHGQSEEALRHRWRHEASVAFSSHSEIQQGLLSQSIANDHDTEQPLFAASLVSDSVLLSALLVFFDAPPSVYNNPTDWKRRMQRAIAVASSSSRACAGFAVDRFLLLHPQDQVTTNEQAFWLRVVSCFLFSG